MIRFRRALAALTLVTAVAACSSGGDSDSSSPPASTTAPAPSGSTAGTGGTTGAPTTGEAPAERSAEVVLTIPNDPAPLDPIRLVTPTDRIVASAMMEPLVELDDTGKLVPALATSWDTTDAQTWDVKLREGVTFSDGTPFDAAAVVANYDRSRDPARNPQAAGLAALIKTVTAVDDHTVQFSLAEPMASFPALLNDTYSNMVSAALLAETNDVGAKPIGTGPFTLTERNASEIVFTRNPNYWNPELPRSERVVFKIIPDTQSQLAALQAGDADVIAGTGATTNEQAAAIDGLEVTQVPGIGTLHIILNTVDAPFSDQRARMALAHATDRDALLLFNDPQGDGEIVDGPWPSGMGLTGAAKAKTFPAYDPAKAQALVDELGGLHFELLTYNVGTYPLMAQFLQDMWAKSGITVEIKAVDVQTVVAETTARSMSATLTTWSGRPDPDLNANRYLNGSLNTPTGLKDPTMDDLLNRARHATAEAERKELYQQVVDRISEIMPILYLSGLNKSTVTTDEVGGIYLPPDGNLRVQHLYIKG
ncbi:MAG: ABC transporter substrate-binding protein [Ilumatobacteraceae bacterium]